MTTLTAETDFALLDRFNSGDEQAFAEIVRRYAGLVYSVCKRVVRDGALAEDVAQETFFKLVQRHNPITSSLAGWLHRSAARLALDALRSESARKRREAAIAAEIQSSTVSDPAAHVDSTIRWADLSPVIDAALAELSDESRTILVQHFLHGVSQLNLAAEHHVSTATMSRRIRNSLDQLRASLNKRGIGASAAALPAMMLFAGTNASAPSGSMLAALGKMVMAHAAGGTFGLGPIVRTAAAAKPGTLPTPFVNRCRVLTGARPAVPALTIVAAVALGLLFGVPSIWIGFSLKADRNARSEPASMEERTVENVRSDTKLGSTAR